jgi:hypothetical protein
LRCQSNTDAIISADLSICQLCGNTPAQIALTQYMQQHPEHIAELADFYQQNEIRLIWVYNNPVWLYSLSGNLFPDRRLH